MAYSITIAGIDRTTDVVNRSVSISDVINDEQNTLSFELIDHTENGLPDTEDEVIITLDDGTVIFGGYITRVVKKISGIGQVGCQVRAIDYSRLLDRSLVHRTYEDMTDAEIIEDIVQTYCIGSGITTNNVVTGVTIDQIAFNYLQPSQCLRKICDLTGRNWYIDYTKDVHYFALTQTPAPFNITDSSTEHKDLQISQDASQLKNRVYVRGGTKLSDTVSYSTKGNGVTRRFVLPDKPHNVALTVNGVNKTVGIKNVDTSGFDYYLNFQEKYLDQDSGATVLGTGDTLTLSYQYDIPILVAVENTASIAANGVKEFAIFDKSITTTQAARDRASAELTDYANSIVEGSFTTYTPGFASGQYININLTDYGINADYLVQRVSAKSIGGGVYQYTVQIASSKTMGVIRFLIELLEANKNLIELDNNEVIDELLSLSDSLNSDSLTEALTIDSTGPYFTWAVAAESTPITTARWDLFQWG